MLIPMGIIFLSGCILSVMWNNLYLLSQEVEALSQEVKELKAITTADAKDDTGKRLDNLNNLREKLNQIN